MAFEDHPDDSALRPGSLILVTGASGYIASHVVAEALQAGYRVRGTFRSEEKAARSRKLHDSENYSSVIVPDMAHENAFQEAVKDVNAVVHTSTVLSWSTDPAKVVDPVLAGMRSILSSCLKEKNIKRFVYTSSSSAICLPKTGVKFHITPRSWNLEVEQLLEGKKGEQDGKGFEVYAWSKTKAERALWDFVEKEKPVWAINTVCPDTNFGKVLGESASTGAHPLSVLEGKRSDIPPQYFINVADDARIHIAALIDKTANNERILAFNEPFNWNQVAKIIEDITGRKTIEQDPDEGEDLSTVDNSRGAELLRKWWRQDGYQGLRESIRQNIEGYY